MTAPLDVLDFGTAPLSPADRAALDVLDVACQVDGAPFELRLAALDADRCQVCGKPGEGSECDSCYAGWDALIERNTDV